MDYDHIESMDVKPLGEERAKALGVWRLVLEISRDFSSLKKNKKPYSKDFLRIFTDLLGKKLCLFALEMVLKALGGGWVGFRDWEIGNQKHFGSYEAFRNDK